MVFVPLKRKSAFGDRPARVAEILAHTGEYLKLRSTDHKALAELLALNRVKRGVRWFNRNAPNRGWWRNCLNGTRSRIRSDYSGESALEIVFEYDPRFTDEYGYAFEPKIRKHFGLNRGRDTERLGFSMAFMDGKPGQPPFPKRYPIVQISGVTIDRAWEYFLQNPDGEMLSRYRHPTFVDRAFAHSAKEPWWRPLLIALSRMGRDARARA